MAWIENAGYVSRDSTLDSKFKWSVPNFFCISENQSSHPCISSPWFSFKGNKWRLVLLPNDLQIGYRRQSEKKMGLFLWRRYSTHEKEGFRVKISLESTADRLNGFSLCQQGEIKYNESFGTWNFLPLSLFRICHDRISPRGNMTFVCELTKGFKREDDDSDSDSEEEDEEEEEDDDDSEDDDDDNDEDLDDSENEKVDANNSSHSRDKGKKNAKGVDRLLQNLEKMFLEAQNTDLELKVENTGIPVHKGILSVRSPVFASMLEHDMKEKNSSVIDIPDCSVDAFKIFLLYLYTGKTDSISGENVHGVYYAADKYQVEDLKENCIKFMKDNLSVDTFCDIMALSLRHSELGLQKAATRFFCKNVKKIIKTPRWQTYLQNNPIQANELYIKAFNA